MSATAPRPGSVVGRGLRHVLLAGVMGVVVAFVGVPLLVAALFGGPVAIVAATVLVVVLACFLAIELDRAAGPGDDERPGSVVRGLVVGGLGSAAAIGGALLAVQADIGDHTPVPLRYAAVAVPFAVLAALQWPGVVRFATAGIVVVGSLAVVVPAGLGSLRDGREERVLTEVGTLEHPWLTAVDGYHLSGSQVTGTPLVWTRLSEDGGRPDSALWLFRDQPVDPAQSDPCAGTSLWTPDGDQPLVSCTQVDGNIWLRASQGWQELARFGSRARVGVTAGTDVPQRAMDEALAAARPMTDDEYDAWLDEGLTPGW